MRRDHFDMRVLFTIVLAMLILIPYYSTASAKGVWVLDKQWTEKRETEAGGDFHKGVVNVGPKSASLTVSFSKSGKNGYSGKATCQATWSAPPEIMKPGEIFKFVTSASTKGHDSRGGYHFYSGCSVLLYVTRLDKMGKSISGAGAAGIKNCAAGIGGGRATANCNESSDWKIPNGSPGEGLVLIPYAHGSGGTAEAHYKYIFSDNDKSVNQVGTAEDIRKRWDFWQDEYRYWEDNLLIPKEKKEKKMSEAKVKLERIKKSYVRKFGSPFPYRDYTVTQYPPQRPRQRDALRIYEDFKRIYGEYEKAEKKENGIIQRIKQFPPAVTTEADIQDREAATREKERWKEKLKPIKEEWANKYHTDYGPLKKPKIIPDPQHHPLDERVRRQVDEMEYKIKDGAYFEKPNTTIRFSKSPEQHQVEGEESNIAVDRSDEEEFQSLGRSYSRPEGHQNSTPGKNKDIPKGHTTKYGF